MKSPLTLETGGVDDDTTLVHLLNKGIDNNSWKYINKYQIVRALISPGLNEITAFALFTKPGVYILLFTMAAGVMGKT